VTSTKSTAFGVSACLLLAGSIVFGQQQDRDLSGIRGIPVEGHDILAGVEIVGTRQLDLSRSGWDERHKRLRANGAELRLGWPLESQTLCCFKEVLRDEMREKGFLDAEITHDTRPTFGNRRDLTLAVTIVEGKRTRRAAQSGATAVASGTLHEMNSRRRRARADIPRAQRVNRSCAARPLLSHTTKR